MNDNLVSMEIAIDATLFVGLDKLAESRGKGTASQLLSFYLPEWVDTILANRSGLASGRKSNRRVA